jgi:hypothetical protein
MMKPARILICGKTYPDVSHASTEMLFSVGCTEKGKPIRLYPIPLRYLANHLSYRAFDWIEAPMAPSKLDPRPECYNVMSSDIQVTGKIHINKAWSNRDRFIYADTSWHYSCLEELKEAQQKTAASVGFIKVGFIDHHWVEKRAESERKAYIHHLEILKNQNRLSDEAAKRLAFVPFRIFVRWRCQGLHGSKDCPGHTAAVLDDAIGQLTSRAGIEKAMQRLQHYTDVIKYDLAFFMCNTKMQPQKFNIIGLWYPPKNEVIKLKSQLRLF